MARRIETNVAAVYFVTVAFLPLLQQAKKFKPSVVNIASMSGITKDSQNHFAYKASKGAATHLVNMMSAEFVDTGIRVNGISPGYFPSEMISKKESDHRQKSQLRDEYVQGKGCLLDDWGMSWIWEVRYCIWRVGRENT